MAIRVAHLISKPPWRVVVPVAGLVALLLIGYLFWNPGLDVQDGRHDLGQNGIWLSRGWLGADSWFIRNEKTNEFSKYRDPEAIRELAIRLRRYHITDVFPHLCPAEPDGTLPPVDHAQVERFLETFREFRVMPWLGGPNGGYARLDRGEWRSAFVTNVTKLLAAHPGFSGVQINIEPLPSGDPNFLKLLDELRAALPKGKLLSVAAYPPPTRWHPYADVHWDDSYFRAVARRSDQLAVMMYDAGQRLPKTYQRLMADWTREVFQWNEGKAVLLGVPTYEDKGVDYHYSSVENLTNALLGIHRGLGTGPAPTGYQGVAIYCDWETSADEWAYFEKHFLTRNRVSR